MFILCANASNARLQSFDNGNLKTLSESGDTINRTDAETAKSRLLGQPAQHVGNNLNRVKSYTDIDGNTIGYRYYDSGKVVKIADRNLLLGSGSR